MAAQAQRAVCPKVVVQVSEADPAKWNLALNSVRSMRADLGATNVDIELVAYGPGIGIRIRMLKADPAVGSRFEEALSAGAWSPAVFQGKRDLAFRRIAKRSAAPIFGKPPAGISRQCLPARRSMPAAAA